MSTHSGAQDTRSHDKTQQEEKRKEKDNEDDQLVPAGGQEPTVQCSRHPGMGLGGSIYTTEISCESGLFCPTAGLPVRHHTE